MMMNPNPNHDNYEPYPWIPSHAILISSTIIIMPQDHSLGAMSNLTRFTPEVLVLAWQCSLSPIMTGITPPGYDVAILIFVPWYPILKTSYRQSSATPPHGGKEGHCLRSTG